MNQRIRELASCNERIQNFFVTGPVQRAAIEDFAELIVRECADLTRWQEYDMSVEKRIRLEIYREIKEHFEVE